MCPVHSTKEMRFGGTGATKSCSLWSPRWKNHEEYHMIKMLLKKKMVKRLKKYTKLNYLKNITRKKIQIQLLNQVKKIKNYSDHWIDKHYEQKTI